MMNTSCLVFQNCLGGRRGHETPPLARKGYFFLRPRPPFGRGCCSRTSISPFVVVLSVLLQVMRRKSERPPLLG